MNCVICDSDDPVYYSADKLSLSLVGHICYKCYRSEPGGRVTEWARRNLPEEIAKLPVCGDCNCPILEKEQWHQGMRNKSLCFHNDCLNRVYEWVVCERCGVHKAMKNNYYGPICLTCRADETSRAIHGCGLSEAVSRGIV